ncbi:MAG: Asp-tRNA(Asn)/Glu-tRNA(Gln) amidotransferase GatCAB subunit C [Rhodospirillaceae bacterium]|nr:Asp-tRNA(Asn)/Glu-tRNA(Gln) amidotransferase GatCAB subunit C [Rhodospirillaceae bacterium]
MAVEVGSKRFPTATHWGTYHAEVEDGHLVAMRDYEKDPSPAIIGPGIVDAVYDHVRVRRPMVRRSFLEKGIAADTAERGAEPFVAVPWDMALDLAAAQIGRVRNEHGNGSIFAGSYGWGSSGRFHHAQSQVHRFMNAAGGYVRHQNSYSHAAFEVMIKHVCAEMRTVMLDMATQWPAIASDCELLVAFGGIPQKNGQVTSGGVGRHTLNEGLQACYDAGVEFVNISPLRNDIMATFDPEWIPIRPNTDAALMLALAHTLVVDNLYDEEFIARYTVGFDRFRPYLLGESDGQTKDVDWAEVITGIPAETVRDLAHRMADNRTMIATAWGIQRGDHGEQPVWLTMVLAALIGQIGLPGGGFGIGYGSENGIGNPVKVFSWPALPQGKNPVDDFIPVARISDLLLNPGGIYDYDGERRTYADIRLVYWAGGNPFHHHQDINRLVEALRRPECVIVNEIHWTAMARYADIVFPATTALERNDLMMCHWEPTITPMHKAIEPVGESRNDYEIFSGLAARLGCLDVYTEGRDEEEWLRHLWDQARQRAGGAGFELPDFETFWREGPREVLAPEKPMVLLEDFRNDPEANTLTTPSGRLEIFSKTIDAFNYEDCPGHPVWMEPYEWLGGIKAETYPLHMISNQPSTRLHSQLDSGSVSRGSKIQGREPMTMHPDDAKERGISSGEVVRVYNDRGACLAGVIVTASVMPGVIQLATGAWYDPDQPGRIGATCKHGNPNVLTHDKGTSSLAQGPTAHSTLVEVERFEGLLPEVTAHSPPVIIEQEI